MRERRTNRVIRALCGVLIAVAEFVGLALFGVGIILMSLYL